LVLNVGCGGKISKIHAAINPIKFHGVTTHMPKYSMYASNN